MQDQETSAPDNRQLELLLFLALHDSTGCGPWQRMSVGEIPRWSVYVNFDS